MKKFKSYFLKASKELQKVFKMYPAVLIVAIFVTICSVLNNELENLFDYDTFYKILFISTVFALGAWFFETVFEIKSVKRYIGLIFSLIFSFVFYYALDEKINFVERLFILYIFALSLGTIYFIHKKIGNDFKEYCLKVTMNMIKTSIYFGFLLLGFLAVCAIFIILILNDNHWELWIDISILAFGSYYVPLIINSFIDMEEDTGTFLKGLLLYVLFPISILATIIIYMYFVKILVTFNLPSNEVFMIISILFATAFPVLVLSNVYKDKEIIGKFDKIYVWAYIPFVLAEIIVITMRVKQYGFTISRYLAYVWIIFQIIAIIHLIYKNGSKLNNIMLWGIFLVFISTISPLNAVRISAISQEKALKELYDTSKNFESLGKKDKIRVSNCYEYLKEYDEDFINSYFSEDEIKTINDFLNFSPSYKNTIIHLSFEQKLENLDITNYSRISKIKKHYYDSDITSQISNYSIPNEKNININVDLTKFKELFLENLDENSDYENLEIHDIILKADEKYDVYITDIGMSYDTDEEEFQKIYSFDGYILERK